MAKIARDLDRQDHIDRLERRYTDLKAQVARLDKQLFLTVQEQLHVTELKKRKLAAKDELTMLRG